MQIDSTCRTVISHTDLASRGRKNADHSLTVVCRYFESCFCCSMKRLMAAAGPQFLYPHGITIINSLATNVKHILLLFRCQDLLEIANLACSCFNVLYHLTFICAFREIKVASYFIFVATTSIDSIMVLKKSTVDWLRKQIRNICLLSAVKRYLFCPGDPSAAFCFPFRYILISRHLVSQSA